MPYLFADNYAAAAALVSICSPFRDDALQELTGRLRPPSDQDSLPRLSTAIESPQTLETATVLFWFTLFDEVPPLRKGNKMSPFLI
jgi:hypothetical protein